jgi:hypothetical protein
MVRAGAFLALLALVSYGCEGVEEEPGEPGAIDAAAPAGASCGEIFGGAPVYLPCGEQEDRCAFFTRGATRRCDVICAEFVAACAASFPADDNCAIAGPDQNCVIPNAAQICVCLKP